jgi:hypothetical protein
VLLIDSRWHITVLLINCAYSDCIYPLIFTLHIYVSGCVVGNGIGWVNEWFKPAASGKGDDDQQTKAGGAFAAYSKFR